MNQIDIDYQNLVRDILQNGYKKNDRTGTGTISVFGRTIRHSMKDGFPLLTTKKMAWKTMVTELLWFLRGDTNIKYLVNNGCHIWDGDCFANYYRNFEKYLYTLPEGSEVEFIINKDKFINLIKTDNEFAKKWGELGPVYGMQWRSWRVGKGIETSLPHPDGGNIYEAGSMYIDQIANVIHLLKTDPDSRRIIVSAWNVGELDQMVLPPCHMMFQFYTRELSYAERYKIWFRNNYETGMEYNEEISPDFDNEYYENTPKRAISLMWNQRSVDVGLGLPFNIASYALLLEIIAKQVNMVPEELIGDLGDCHIYNNHIDGLKEQLDRIPYELPKLDIHPGILDYDLDKLEKDMFTIENYQSHPSIKLPLSN